MDTSTLVILLLLVAPWLLLIFVSLLSKKTKKSLQEKLESSNSSVIRLQNEKDDLLNRYSSIIDVEAHIEDKKVEAENIIKKASNTADEILADARKWANAERADSENTLQRAKSEAQTIVQEARKLRSEATEKVKDSKVTAESIKAQARDEASKVILYAENQAKEIAGDAYEAKAKADQYETAIKAMRNTIDGYKDDYIIPNHSVLDDLADEYSHKEAGEELKAARKRVRDMVKEGHAGSCDYAEINRRTYAIHFAVDAFNGKVDSALAKVKHDNYGKIKQEIIDAYALVNHNGSPFRNARINQEFLDARLTELKWAVAAFELRKIEREEQAELKAQMREEERAIREMEKARKEAEKEERFLQKALEKAKAELGQASEEQKAEYEAQLAELEGKLKEAEEKGQRAISMAQQTRRGHVYVISNIGSFGEQVFKIGMTRRLEPLDRVKELGDASVPFSFDVHAMIYSDDAPTLEKELHAKFNLQSVNKINPRKEFFRTTIAEIKQAVENNGIAEAHWTMKAEASEYRETLAIEKELEEVNVA